jgi:fructose-1,6-bisphosphatase
MSTNLKRSTEGLIEAFEHHLVYEVNMLRHTYLFLCVPAWSGELRNALIEAFSIHARNLVEFFDQQSQTAGQAKSDYQGAKHFCKSDYQAWSKGRPSQTLLGKINRQIAHLTYDRTAQEEGKLGTADLNELFNYIQQELQEFGKSLREPYAAKWPFRGSASEIKNPRGPTGPASPPVSIANN